MQNQSEENHKPSEADLEESRKRLAGAAVSKMVASAIGDMVTLYSKDSAHKHFSFDDMDWKILPPIVNGQFFISNADDPDFGTLRPIGLVTWAKVSDELNEKLSYQIKGKHVRLRPQEWASGDNVWLVDVVGTHEGVLKALKFVHENQLSGVEAKVLTRNKGEKLEISTLASLLLKMEKVE